MSVSLALVGCCTCISMIFSKSFMFVLKEASITVSWDDYNLKICDLEKISSVLIVESSRTTRKSLFICKFAKIQHIIWKHTHTLHSHIHSTHMIYGKLFRLSTKFQCKWLMTLWMHITLYALHASAPVWLFGHTTASYYMQCMQINNISLQHRQSKRESTMTTTTTTAATTKK